MKQNIFDNENFFNGYRELRNSGTNLNDLLMQPAMEETLPDLKGKTVLDIGCGYGHNCLEFINKGAKKVVGRIYRKKCWRWQKKNPPTRILSTDKWIWRKSLP